jgi:hypothetical protein
MVNRPEAMICHPYLLSRFAACLNAPALYDARHSVMGFEANTYRIWITPKRHVARVDNVFGGRNPLCACVRMEALA